ncbi:polysaccharide deacetylase family protein [Burkholderiaceae bacterium UC74_6]
MLWRGAFSLQSPGGAGKLSILIFHRVLPKPDPLFPGEVHAQRFDQLLGWLKSWFNVLPLSEAVSLLSEGRLPARAAVITFDDGYADNATEATPLLVKHGLSATFFVSAAFLDGSCMWNDGVIETLREARVETLDLAAIDPALPQTRLGLTTPEQRRAAIDQVLSAIKYLPFDQRLDVVSRLARACGVELPRGLMMSPDQLRGMQAAGMTIGAHTMTHPILATLDDDAARHEIVESRRVLEDIARRRIGLFAYPNGKPGQDYSLRSRDLVKEAGFDAAVSTAWGVASQGCDLFQLPRFTPWDAGRMRFSARLAQNLARSETVPPLLG